MMAKNRARAAILAGLGGLAALIAAILYVVFLMYKPAYSSSMSAQNAVQMGRTGNGLTATVHLNIEQAVGVGPHADWVGYQTPNANDPHPGAFFHVPANTLVTVIIHNYDSQTALRNNYFTLVQGTVGGREYVNGKAITVMDPAITSHTFTIADLGVNVPMMGIPSNAKANSYETMKFTFRASKKGVFRWQCIVPCGFGLYGNGGPMQALGYMDGLITVT